MPGWTRVLTLSDGAILALLFTDRSKHPAPILCGNRLHGPMI